MRNANNLLVSRSISRFPVKNIWIASVPSKVSFFVWEAAWGKVLTLDELQIRGWHLPNRCFLCGCAKETIYHILLHCLVVRPLWEIILSLVGVSWVFSKDVKDILLSWKGSFVGKKRRMTWNSVPLYIFWTVWKERNRIAFRNETLATQRLKHSFVSNLWFWNSLHLGEVNTSLLGFLEWFASS